MEKQSGRSIIHNIEKSEMFLDDLSFITEKNFRPIVDQIKHHLFEAKDAVTRNESDFSQELRAIRTYVTQMLTQLIDQFAKDKMGISKTTISVNVAKDSLRTVNHFIDSIQSVLELMEMFKYYESVSIGFEAGQLTIRGPIRPCDYTSDFKKKVYALTRDFLKRRVLLTYEIIGADKEHIFELVMYVDYRDSDKEFYIVSVPERDLSIAIPNVFYNYSLKVNEFHNIGRHPAIEIDKDLNVHRHQFVHESTLIEYESNTNPKGIFFLPSFFRPISIILPKKGNLEKLSFSSFNLKSSGQNGVSYVKSENQLVYLIDLFSTML